MMSEPDCKKLGQQLEYLKKCLALKEKQLKEWDAKRKRHAAKKAAANGNDPAVSHQVKNCQKANFITKAKVSNETSYDVQNGNISFEESFSHGTETVSERCHHQSNEIQSLESFSQQKKNFSHSESDNEQCFGNEVNTDAANVAWGDIYSRIKQESTCRKRSELVPSNSLLHRRKTLTDLQVLSNAMIASAFDFLVRETKNLSTVEFFLPLDEYDLESDKCVQSETEDTDCLLDCGGDVDEVVAQTLDVWKLEKLSTSEFPLPLDEYTSEESVQSWTKDTADCVEYYSSSSSDAGEEVAHTFGDWKWNKRLTEKLPPVEFSLPPDEYDLESDECVHSGTEETDCLLDVDEVVAHNLDIYKLDTLPTKKLSRSHQRDDYDSESEESIQNGTEDTVELLQGCHDVDEVVAQTLDVWKLDKRPNVEIYCDPRVKNDHRKVFSKDKLCKGTSNKQVALENENENLGDSVIRDRPSEIRKEVPVVVGENDILQHRNSPVGKNNLARVSPSVVSGDSSTVSESKQITDDADVSVPDMNNSGNGEQCNASKTVSFQVQYRFAGSIGTYLEGESVVNVDCGTVDTTIAVQQKTRVTVWMETNDGWRVSAECKISQGGAVVSCCVLDSWLVILAHCNQNDVLVHIYLSKDETIDEPTKRCRTLGYRSAVVPLLCRVGTTRFALCMNAEDSTSVVTMHGEDGALFAELETVGDGRITSICGVHDLERVLVGTSGAGELLIWNCEMLQRKIPLDKLGSCLAAISEAGLLFCLLKTTDQDRCHLVAFNVSSGSCHGLRTYDLSGNDRLCFSSGCRYFSSVRDGNEDVRLWDILTGEVVARIGLKGISAVKVTPTRLFVGYKGGYIHVYTN